MRMISAGLVTQQIEFSRYRHGSVTSASAMIFMEDSERAAELASGSGLDVGLHLNFTQPYTQKELASPLAEYQARIAEFLTNNRFAQLFYHPCLRKQFHYV